MKIALDMEGTLTAEVGEFACERPHGLAQYVLPLRLRRGAPALLRELQRSGHRLTLYSLRSVAPWRIRLWCRLQGLPINRIITADQEEQRRLRAQRKQQKRFAQERELLGLNTLLVTGVLAWPPCSGHDLLFDDDPRHVQAARHQGVAAAVITNLSEDWTIPIREVALAPAPREASAPLEA